VTPGLGTDSVRKHELEFLFVVRRHVSSEVTSFGVSESAANPEESSYADVVPAVYAEVSR